MLALYAAISIALDTTLNEDLIEEGLAREIVNRIQKARKEADFHVADRIHLHYQASDKLVEVFKKHGTLIQKETLALSAEAEMLTDASHSVCDIDGEQLLLRLEKA